MQNKNGIASFFNQMPRMLLPTMTPHEVTAEILRERLKIETSVFDRLFEEYDRERRKLKIDKSKLYPKCYPVKTKGKNTWLLFMQKSPGEPKYRDSCDAVACAVVYYYGAKGLKAIRYNKEGKFMEVFNGHFFVRYNERMKLGLVHMVDMIKAFFNNSGYLQIQRRQEGDKECSVSVCKDGIALGNFYYNPDWLVHKTFISRDLKRYHQDVQENGVLAKMQLRLLKAQLAGSQNTKFDYETLKQIVGDGALSIEDFKDDPDLLMVLKEQLHLV